MGIFFALIILAIILGGAAALGMAARRGGKYETVFKYFLWGYVAFAGCFEYPIKSQVSPLDLSKLYLLIVSYGVIALGFAGVYGEKKGKKIYLLTLVLTLAGLLCRYFLEYGEVSNTFNFTPGNVIVYAAVMPLYAVTAYCLIVKRMKRKGRE